VIESAAVIQFFFQHSPCTVKPYLYGIKQNLKDIGYLPVFKSFKLAKQHNGFIVGREPVDKLFYTFAHLLADNRLVDVGFRMAGPNVSVFNFHAIFKGGMFR